MPSFQYKAKDSKGKFKTGVMEAQTRGDVEKKLRSSRLQPLAIKVAKDNWLSRIYSFDKNGKFHFHPGGGMPNLKELGVFTKQFALMIERGVPLIQSLEILASQQTRHRFAEVIEKIRTMVENGATFSSAIANFPRVFNELYVAMVKSGEVSGSLDTVLKEIVKFLEKAAKLRQQLRSASIYPGMITFVAFSITYLILVFLVPVFAEQYKSMNQELPALTQFVIQASTLLTKNIHYCVGAGVGAFMLFNRYRATPVGKLKTDNMFLSLPVIGNVLKKIAISRFCSTMATMLNSGVSILDALEICGQSSGNKVIEAFVYNVKEKISQGANFATPLAEGGLFPPMVISMVAVGEQTGALDETLTKVAEIYEEEVDVAVKSMTDMMQPALIIVIGVILGVIIIALYLPIFDQANLAGGK